MHDEPRSASQSESALRVAGTGWADIHVHTNLGDGWISPARLIQTAALRQSTLIAVTDHDHVEGARRVEDPLHKQNSPMRMTPSAAWPRSLPASPTPSWR